MNKQTNKTRFALPPAAVLWAGVWDVRVFPGPPLSPTPLGFSTPLVTCVPVRHGSWSGHAITHPPLRPRGGCAVSQSADKGRGM